MVSRQEVELQTLPTALIRWSETSPELMDTFIYGTATFTGSWVLIIVIMLSEG
ncbi:hypothetical protein GJ744_001354 [Endocarpon pusillum]|uniref:Uncharacterized protein n=1 Tax=Endocarpon pusillum TaxID=364733 RepID=A0A8H7ARW7_9EURO|nr:hypothetical protein GJ744_001354 [Endocarpon pusillum]